MRACVGSELVVVEEVVRARHAAGTREYQGGAAPSKGFPVWLAVGAYD